MFKILIISLVPLLFTLSLHAESNNTAQIKVKPHTTAADSKKDANTTKSEKEKRMQKQIEAQMEKEKKYAKEKTFYQGPEYDLSAYEIDPKSLDNIEVVEPDYDFNMDDVYD